MRAPGPAIVYLVTAEHAYTMGKFLDSWGRAWRDRIRVVSYAEALATPRSGLRARLPGARRLPERATWIFSDVERMTPAAATSAAALWERLAAAGARLLNHPTRSMRRYELLRTLHARGRNRFGVYRADEVRRPERYPVFLRDAHEHTGSRTPLLADEAALDAALADLLSSGASRADTLVVEFCDTADAAGCYRKYSAFVVDGRVLPRHLFFAHEWQVKTATSYAPGHLEEERRYLAANPHEATLREIFALARIDWGRIDYALLGDAVQVWEINSNPMILTAAHAEDGARRPVHEAFAARLDAELLRLS